MIFDSIYVITLVGNLFISEVTPRCAYITYYLLWGRISAGIIVESFGCPISFLRDCFGFYLFLRIRTSVLFASHHYSSIFYKLTDLLLSFFMSNLFTIFCSFNSKFHSLNYSLRIRLFVDEIRRQLLHSHMKIRQQSKDPLSLKYPIVQMMKTR